MRLRFCWGLTGRDADFDKAPSDNGAASLPLIRKRQ